MFPALLTSLPFALLFVFGISVYPALVKGEGLLPGAGCRIDFIVPLTGVLAPWGDAIQKGAQLAVKEKNAPITLRFGDDRFSAAEAVNVYRDFKRAPKACATVVFGGQSVKAVRPLAESNEDLLFAVTADGTFKGSRQSYRLYVSSDGQVAEILEFVQKAGSKRVAMVVSQQETMQEYRQKLEPKLLENKLSITSVVEFLPSERDFRSAVQKLRRTSPDVVIFATIPPHTSLLRKQMLEQGWNPLSIGFIPTEVADEVRSAGGAMEGMYYVSGEMSVEFKDLYSKHYASEPYPVAASGFDAVTILNSINQGAGLVPASRIAEAVRGISGVHGAFGMLSFLANNELDVRHKVRWIKDDRFQDLPNE